jgi:hypothetical protein
MIATGQMTSICCVPSMVKRPGRQRLVVLRVAGENAGRVAADTEKRRMAERYQPAMAERHVEPDGGNRENRHLGRQRDNERFAI